MRGDFIVDCLQLWDKKPVELARSVVDFITLWTILSTARVELVMRIYSFLRLPICIDSCRAFGGFLVVGDEKDFC